MERVDDNCSDDYAFAIIRPAKQKKLLDMLAIKIASIINLRIKVAN